MDDVAINFVTRMIWRGHHPAARFPPGARLTTANATRLATLSHQLGRTLSETDVAAFLCRHERQVV